MSRDPFESGAGLDKQTAARAGAGRGGTLVGDFIGRLRRDVLHYAPAAFVPAGVSVAGVAVFTRIFGPEAYGRYSLVIAATTIATALLSGWIQQSLLRYLPRYREEGQLPLFMARFSVLVMTIALATLGILLLLYPLLRNVLGEYTRFYFPGAVLILTGILFQTLSTAFQADLQSGRYAKYKISYAVGRLAVALGFVFLISRDIIGLIFGMVVSHLVLIGFLKWELGIFRALKRAGGSFDFDFFKKFVAYGFPMIGWLMGGQILAISDRFVIGAFAGAPEVGIYAANYSLVSMGIGLLTSPLIMAAHPLVINAWEKADRSAIPGMIAALSRFYIIAVIPVVFFVGAFSRELAGVLLGTEYREGYVIIPFVLAGHMIWGLSMYGQKGFELLEKTRVMLVLVALCAACNILLNLVFVPMYGYFAAAVTTFVSYSLYPFMVYRMSRSLLPWRLPWRTIGRVLVSSVLMTAVLLAVRKYWFAPLHPVITIVLGGIGGFAVYAALLFLLREFKEGK